MKHGMCGQYCPSCGQAMGHGMRGKRMWMKGMFMMPWKMMKIREKLKLSDDQVNKMRDIWTNMAKQKVQIKSQIMLAKIDLKSMLFREDMNMGEVEQKIRDIHSLKADKKILWIKSMREMRDVLTHDQRDEIKSMMMCAWDGGEEEEEGEEGEEGEGEEEE